MAKVYHACRSASGTEHMPARLAAHGASNTHVRTGYKPGLGCMHVIDSVHMYASFTRYCHSIVYAGLVEALMSASLITTCALECSDRYSHVHGFLFVV